MPVDISLSPAAPCRFRFQTDLKESFSWPARKQMDQIHRITGRLGGKIRRYYTITPTGRRLLKKAKKQLMELVGEILSSGEIDRLVALSERHVTRR